MAHTANETTDDSPYVDPYHEDKTGSRQYLLPCCVDKSDPLIKVQREPLTPADVASIRHLLLTKSIHALSDERAGEKGRADVLAWILRADNNIYGDADPCSFEKCCCQEGVNADAMREKIFNNYVDLHVDSMVRGQVYEWLFDPLDTHPDDMSYEQCCSLAGVDAQTLKTLLLAERGDRYALLALAH